VKKTSALAVTALALALALCGSVATAEDQLVLSAQPATKVESGPGASERFILSGAQAQDFSVTIVKRGDRYFWASRENRELLHAVSGIYHLFIDPRGGGYIKVENQSLLSESMRDPGPPVRYLEQVTLGLGTITYWGSTETFSP
jgi:hypothetical protein